MLRSCLLATSHDKGGTQFTILCSSSLFILIEDLTEEIKLDAEPVGESHSCRKRYPMHHTQVRANYVEQLEIMNEAFYSLFRYG